MNNPAKTKINCFTIDLVNSFEMIAKYEHYHKKEVVWPQIIAGIKAVGVLEMDIYRTGNRLVMIVKTPEVLDLNAAFKDLEALPEQKEWALLMAQFQVRTKGAMQGEHWSLMKHIFDLND